MENKKVIDLLQHAYTSVPFYQHKYAACSHLLQDMSSFELIPYLTKEEIFQYQEKMMATGISSENYVWEFTSGTTGTPLKIGKTNYERTRTALVLMKWRQMHFGIRMNDPYAYFTTIDSSQRVVQKLNANFFSEIHLDDASFEIYYEVMQQNKVKWMFNTPSVTYILMNFMKRYNKKPLASLQYIELTGEQVLQKEKQRFEDFFGCRVGEQYGVREVWAIAKECSHRRLHVLEDHILLELLNPHGILVTDLDLYSMPIIRYYVEDKLKYGKLCTCGLSTKTIEIVKSRALEFLYIGKDVFISPILLRICINELMKDRSLGIEQFQYIQKSCDSVICYLVYRNSSYSCHEISRKLYQLISRLYPLPDFFRINVIKVDSLTQYVRRGKLGYFKSELLSPYQNR